MSIQVTQGVEHRAGAATVTQPDSELTKMPGKS